MQSLLCICTDINVVPQGPDLLLILLEDGNGDLVVRALKCDPGVLGFVPGFDRLHE